MRLGGVVGCDGVRGILVHFGLVRREGGVENGRCKEGVGWWGCVGWRKCLVCVRAECGW